MRQPGRRRRPHRAAGRVRRCADRDRRTYPARAAADPVLGAQVARPRVGEPRGGGDLAGRGGRGARLVLCTDEPESPGAHGRRGCGAGGGAADDAAADRDESRWSDRVLVVRFQRGRAVLDHPRVCRARRELLRQQRLRSRLRGAIAGPVGRSGRVGLHRGRRADGRQRARGRRPSSDSRRQRGWIHHAAGAHHVHSLRGRLQQVRNR